MRNTFLAIIILGLTACDKNELTAKTETAPTGTNFKVGYFAQYSSFTNVNTQLKIDDKRMSGVFTSPTPYPGGGFNTGGTSAADYLSIDPGTKRLKVSFPKTGSDVDSVVLYDQTNTIVANARQTLMITDTGANVTGTMLIDDITSPTTAGTARAKFFNGMPGATLDFYIRSSLGTFTGPKNIAYKGVSSYFDFPAGFSNDTLDVVTAGTTYTSATTPLARYIWTQTNIVPTRVYTIVAAGYPSVSYTATVTVNNVVVADNRRARVAVVLNK